MNKPLLCSVALALMTLLSVDASAQDLLAKRKDLGEKVYGVKKIASEKPQYFLKTASAQVPISNTVLQKIKIDWVKSVSVLKEKPEVAQPGVQARNGAVLIELEPEHEPAFLQLLKKLENSAENEEATSLDGSTGITLPLPLYVVKTQTGEVAVSKEAVSAVSPEWIESIEVLRETEAEKKYKEKGRNGVILITFVPEKEQEILRQIQDSN
ncbi:hypothetical protein ACFSC6_00940 [Rufibacter sediminis]|uniref:Uncharacterized protein n=1 Tax=Rufibacter sediminis TaxID=2762756 RepID=A0ABR6VLF7_9BACT|nr:hypothetical protein [Rufibacter sediminis]MBC3538084.1 hypothetical protein [Rufibacter sediminis]